MTRLKALWVGAALAALGGCQSLGVMALKSLDQKPYSFPVAAQPLDVAALPAEAEALTAATDLTAAALAPEPQAEAEPEFATASLGEVESTFETAPEAEPERTEIRGQGDGLMVVDRVVVNARKEIAHRVPDYSREQVAAMLCARSSGGSTSRQKAAQRAYDLTVAAYDSRIAHSAGQISARDDDRAERKRQDAVGALTRNNFLFNMFGGRSKKEDLPKAEHAGLVLEDVDLYTFNEAGRPVMAVSGVVRNTTEERAEPPPVTLAAIDGWEFILAGQTSLLPFQYLEPGEAKAFEVRFHNPPDTTYEVYVHFAPPFEYRLRRDCGSADAGEEGVASAPRSATDATMTNAPTHTASELNLLTRIYRGEAESAWNQRACGLAEPADQDTAGGASKSRRALQVGQGSGGERRSLSVSLNLGRFNSERVCSAWARRLPWRDSFALGEAADKAWGASLAVDEMQQQQAGGDASAEDVAEAVEAFQRDYAAFRALGAATLARAGASVEGVEIAIASSTFGYDQISRAFDGADISEVGHYVDVAGVLRNTAPSPRKIDAVMLALVDRLEQPLLTFRLDDAVVLGPGETRAFEHRVYFSDPVRRREATDKPPWQVRVGAVGAPGPDRDGRS